MLTEHFSVSQTDQQTGRMKERTCFQRQAKAYCSFLSGKKKPFPAGWQFSYNPTWVFGAFSFSFVICVLDELHLIESSGNVLSDLLKLFLQYFLFFSLTKNIIQNLVSCPPRQHFQAQKPVSKLLQMLHKGRFYCSQV